MSTADPDLVGRQLRDSDDQPVGTITAAYRYPADMNAPWGAAAVTQGLVLRSTCLVDLEDADIDNDTVRVPHTRHTIKTAPYFVPLIGDTLSGEHAAAVRAHYWGAAQFA